MTTEPLNLLLAGKNTATRKDLIQQSLTTLWNISTWSEDENFGRFVELLPKADAVVAGSIKGTWPSAPNLKLRQVPHTGINWVSPNDMPKGCIVCNTFGHEIAIAEYILACMLDLAIGLSKIDRTFKKDFWADYHPGIGPNHLELYGKTAGIIGYGHIGREVAARANAFGMKSIAVSRTIYPAPELASFKTMADIDQLLATADYIILALPLSDETNGLIDADKFSKMKSDAVLINVGRGHVVDESALYSALLEKRIRGAAIDVWYQYPKDGDADCAPSKHPFENLENAIMTPHCSGSTDAMRDRRWTFIISNLDRFARGEPIENFCFEGTRPDV